MRPYAEVFDGGEHSATVRVGTQCKAASSQCHSPVCDHLTCANLKSHRQENMEFGLSHEASMALVWDIVKVNILEEQNAFLVVWGRVPYLYSCPKTIFYCAEEPVIQLALRATQPPEYDDKCMTMNLRHLTYGSSFTAAISYLAQSAVQLAVQTGCSGTRGVSVFTPLAQEFWTGTGQTLVHISATSCGCERSW